MMKTNINYNRPTIDAEIKDLTVIGPLAWEALVKYNDPPFLFQKSGLLVMIKNTDNGLYDLKSVDDYTLRHLLARSAKYIKPSKNIEEDPALPPMHLVHELQAWPEYPVPEIIGIVQHPFFDKHGKLNMETGYNKSTLLYYAPQDIDIPEVNENPSEKEIEIAKKLINEPLQDFPFQTNADKTNAISFMLSGFCLPLTGKAPMQMTTADNVGSGKGLLDMVTTYPSTGGHVSSITAGSDDDEYRKRLTSVMREGREIIQIDNISKNIESPSLCSFVTSDTWTDRILGRNDLISFKSFARVILNGNNIIADTEILRRSIRCRLQSNTEKPWLRDGFKIPNLKQFIIDNRGRMIWACLTLIQSWIAAGMPEGKKINPLGSFEQWSHVIGNILNYNGYKDFMGNNLELYDEADSESSAWINLCQQWYDKYADEPIIISELYEIARDIDGLPLYSRTETGNKMALGKALARQKGRVFGDLQVIHAGIFRRMSKWSLKRLSEEKHEYGVFDMEYTN